MNEVTVIIPIHKFDDLVKDNTQRAINSVNECQEQYDGHLNILIVQPDGLEEYNYNSTIPVRYIINNGNSDYCSQINFAVQNVTTEHFSILEFDDYFKPKWFKMASEYDNDSVSVLLPINIVNNSKTNVKEFVNDIVWASSFSNEIGYIDNECLQNTASFNMTGGIFRTSDWLSYKPSIKVAFNYEYLLRATSEVKGERTAQKIYVVPKEGYHHEIFREGSLISSYVEEISEEDTEKWFELAKRESSFSEDRNRDIVRDKKSELQ